jgi:hypothetical protein
MLWGRRDALGEPLGPDGITLHARRADHLEDLLGQASNLPVADQREQIGKVISAGFMMTLDVWPAERTSSFVAGLRKPLALISEGRKGMLSLAVMTISPSI